MGVCAGDSVEDITSWRISGDQRGLTEVTALDAIALCCLSEQLFCLGSEGSFDSQALQLPDLSLLTEREREREKERQSDEVVTSSLLLTSPSLSPSFSELPFSLFFPPNTSAQHAQAACQCSSCCAPWLSGSSAADWQAL